MRGDTDYPSPPPLVVGLHTSSDVDEALAEPFQRLYAGNDFQAHSASLFMGE